MNFRALSILVITIFLSFKSIGQVVMRVQGGVSYIEHFSTGLALTFVDKHTISFLCGTNFFINTYEFSNLMLQYDLRIHRLAFWHLTPKVGIKGGDSIFTDEYYRWKVLNIIPYLGLQRTVRQKTDFFLEVGPAFSFEQKVKRIKSGEIGHYRELLPEFKLGIQYTIYSRSKR